MRMAVWWTATLLILCGGSARAGAWPQAPGATQAILKVEQETGDTARDASGDIVRAGRVASDRVSLLVEHGLTRSLTVAVDTLVERGREGPASYEGVGPVTLAAQYTLVQRGPLVLSLRLGATSPGVWQKSRYQDAVETGHWEARLQAGWSFRLAGQRGYMDLEAARLQEHGRPDQSRLDATLSLGLGYGFSLLEQVYSGRLAGAGSRVAWLKADQSLVRSFGPWTLQAGWRHTLSGTNLPVTGGPVLTIWRRF